MNKGEFLGLKQLLAQRQEVWGACWSASRCRTKLIARDGGAVCIGTREAGRVTSGSHAPFLKKNIGMAYVPAESSAEGTEIQIPIRANEGQAKIVPMPFYKRAK